ncbi:Ff.00g115010.m01.CDS01 [Fusarium sp. VM40]|nr:Ff.00g115010.m01.CDS01 [Fusarium sp. VM40]
MLLFVATGISNQDLYELVQDAHNGAILFSTLKQAVTPLIRQLEENYSTIIESSQTHKNRWQGTTGVITGVAIYCFWNPVGWAAFGACLISASVGYAAGEVHSKWDAKGKEASGKKDKVKELKLAIKGVDECANQAREAIAMVFCGQVMQKRLDENLPEHDRRAILATVGVDVDAVSDSVYRQELIRDRVRQLREKNRNLCNIMERVLEDANVEPETTEQAM